jgi:hypothetical protein
MTRNERPSLALVSSTTKACANPEVEHPGFPCAHPVLAPERCTEHPAYDADYCPVCGTARVIGGAL